MDASTLEAFQRMINAQMTEMRDLREQHKTEMQQQREAAAQNLQTLMDEHKKDTEKITNKLSEIQTGSATGRGGSTSVV